MKVDATLAYVNTLAAQPEGAEAMQEIPEAVTAELTGAAISVGAFWKLVPLLVELARNPAVRTFIAELVKVLRAGS
jgi:hypothetical protein